MRIPHRLKACLEDFSCNARDPAIDSRLRSHPISAMKSALCCFTLLILTSPGLFAAGKELEGERAAAQTECPSPEEARAKMSVPQGYEVRCFAHEPMVKNPVAMTW